MIGLIGVSVVAGGVAVGQNWRDERTAGPFVCRAEFDLAPMEGLLADLGQLEADLMGSLDLPKTKGQVSVLLFADERSYRAFLGRYLPDVPKRRALFVKRGDGAVVLAYRSRDLDADLRHECTHALLHAALPMVPLWLDEGLAEYFEAEPTDRAFDNSHLSSTRWNARLGIVPKLTDLESKRDLSQMRGREYRDAWAWVHFMLHGPPEARAELVGYLSDIRDLTPPGKLSQRLEQRIPRVSGRFGEHFRKWKR